MTRGITGFEWETAEEIDLKLAERFVKVRKRRKITQKNLSERSGVSYGSIRRFEKTGQISLLALTRLALALDVADEVRRMFSKVPYQDIEEVVNERKI